MKSMLYYLGNVIKKTGTISASHICSGYGYNHFVEPNCKIENK